MRKRRDFDYANYCLEKWAEWSEDDNGFPTRSPTAKYGELKAHRSESSLPTNIEPNSRDIDRAILVLGLMKGSSSKSAEYAEILKKVNRSRCNDESIKQAMERLEIGKGEAVYYMALDEFTMRLEVLIYAPKDTQTQVKALNEKIKPCITHEF